MINRNKGNMENVLKAEFGKGDRIAKGITLYDINIRLANANARFTSATDFSCPMNDNYMYCKSTTPSVFGSYADPAFEVHFDMVITGRLNAMPVPSPASKT